MIYYETMPEKLCKSCEGLGYCKARAVMQEARRKLESAIGQSAEGNRGALHEKLRDEDKARNLAEINGCPNSTSLTS